MSIRRNTSSSKGLNNRDDPNSDASILAFAKEAERKDRKNDMMVIITAQKKIDREENPRHLRLLALSTFNNFLLKIIKKEHRGWQEIIVPCILIAFTLHCCVVEGKTVPL